MEGLFSQRQQGSSRAPHQGGQQREKVVFVEELAQKHASLQDHEHAHLLGRRQPLEGAQREEQEELEHFVEEPKGKVKGVASNTYGRSLARIIPSLRSQLLLAQLGGW